MKKLSCLSILFLFSFFGHSQCSGYTLSISSNDATCFEFCDGSLTASTSGGNGGDSYTILDSSGTQVNITNTANGLCAGWYYVSVIDNMGCLLEDSTYVDDSGEIDIDYSILNLTCFNDSSGSINVDTVYNYQGSYNNISYFWSPNPNGTNGIGQDSIGGLTAAQYALSIIDEFGCSNTFDTNISEPAELFFSELGFEPCEGGINGVIYMAASGGTPAYDYTWTDLTSSGTSNSTTWGGLDYGCYEGMIVDANGCIITDTLCLSCLGIDELSFNVSIYPNPASDYVFIGGDSQDQLDISLTSISGTEIYSEVNFTLGNKISVTDFPNGIYVIRLKNQEQIGYYRFIKE